MYLLATAATVALVGGIVAACFGCDCDEGTPLARLLVVPHTVLRVLDALHLGWVPRGLARGAHWFMNARHPLIQILYAVLVFGGYLTFVWFGYPLLGGPYNLYMAAYHRWIGAAVFVVCIVTFLLASFVDPGVVTAANVTEYMRLFRYDGFLYELKDCATCAVPKVARSKHCRVCNHCVAKFDHHCIWLNACVGERNHRWFMAYLLSNTTLLLYGIAACVSVLMSDVVRNRLFEAHFVNRATGERMPAGYRIVFQYLMYQHAPIVMVLLLCAVMGVVLTGFTAYHLYLLVANTTTNESLKWRDAEWHHEGAVAKYRRAVAEHAKLQALIDAENAKVGKPPAAEAGARLADGADGGGSGDGAKKELRLDPPAHLLPCLEGRCKHADHAQYAGRKVSGWVLREPPPVPPNAYDLGWRGNVAECVWPPALYGRPRAGPASPPVPPLSKLARGGAGGGGKKKT
jgi:palmitoyltransferase ZDHHC4